MPTPSTGSISFSDIARIVYNNSTATISLNDSDVRSLTGAGSGAVSMEAARGKPTAGNTGTTYHSPGSYSWVVVPYENLTATVAGGGGGGGGGCGGQLLFIPNFGLVCVNYCASSAGNAGGTSTFNGVEAYGGGGGGNCTTGSPGSNGGNNQNGNTGGGPGGGAGGVPGGVNCSQSDGSTGGAGGIAQRTWRKAAGGPGYGATINFTVGAGGTGVADGCRAAPGGTGGSGYVTISWS